MSDSDLDSSLSGMHSQDEKIETNETVSQSSGLDLSAFVMPSLIVAIVGGLIAWMIYSTWEENRPVYQLQYLAQKEVSIKVLLPQMQEYVRQHYPSNGKRLVVYAPELNSDTCPYRRDFVRSFYQEKDNPHWKASYEFVPQVRQAYGNTQKELNAQLKNLHDFVEKVCGYICIMDVQENWVFEIKNGSTLTDALRGFESGI